MGDFGRGAVKRLLDGNHVGIARGLLQELHHHIERFVRMVDDQVLLPDGGKAIAAVVADALGIARIVRHEFEVGPVEPGELREIVERKHAVDQEHLVVGDRERPLHEFAQLGRHGALELKPDHRTAAALFERGLVEAYEVFRLFLDFHFRSRGSVGRRPAP